MEMRAVPAAHFESRVRALRSMVGIPAPEDGGGVGPPATDLGRGISAVPLGRVARVAILLAEVPPLRTFPGHAGRAELLRRLRPAVDPSVLLLADASGCRIVCSWWKPQGEAEGLYREEEVPDRREAQEHLLRRATAEAGGETIKREPPPGDAITRAFLRKQEGSASEPAEGGDGAALGRALRAILDASSPAETRRAWRVLREITLLDLDCGDGSWLIAAAEPLASLYEACLCRMAGWVLDRRCGGRGRMPALRDLQALVERWESAGPEAFPREMALLHNLRGIGRTSPQAECARLRLALWAAPAGMPGEATLPLLAHRLVAGSPLDGGGREFDDVPAGDSGPVPLLRRVRECEAAEEILIGLHGDGGAPPTRLAAAYRDLAARRLDLSATLVRTRRPRPPQEHLTSLRVWFSGVYRRGGFTLTRTAS